MGVWEALWKMKFHATKCNVLSITGNWTPIKADYALHGHKLSRLTSAKYLGVTITDDLKWDSHISEVCAKANRTIGFLSPSYDPWWNMQVQSWIRIPTKTSRSWRWYRDGQHVLPPADTTTDLGPELAIP